MFELFGSVQDALATVESIAAQDIEQQPGKIICLTFSRSICCSWRVGRTRRPRLPKHAWATSPYAHVRRMPQFARWMAGQPAELLPDAEQRDAGRPPYVPEADANDRYRFNFLAFAAVVAASLGDRSALRHVTAQLDASGLGEDTRDAAMLAVAAAARAVVDGDEAAARGVIEDFVIGHPLDDPVASVHLRRFLAYGYVLSPEARRVWDAEPLGPSHERVRRAARLLLAARAGRLTALDVPAETILTAFPLPWAVELAAHAEAAGLPAGRQLAQWLVDRLGRTARDALQALDGDPRNAVATGARRLLLAVPATPERHIGSRSSVRCACSGTASRSTLRSCVGGASANFSPSLAVHPVVDRATLMICSPTSPAGAARNLRVTLTYLRRVLEPTADRDAGFHLRCAGPGAAGDLEGAGRRPDRVTR